MKAVEERARARAGEVSDGPGFLERRPESGLFPDLSPDPVMVQKIKRIDPRWRVEWHRGLGRFCLYHDHEHYGRAQVPTLVVQTADGKYMPLDERTVRQVEFGAWAARNFRDTTDFDECLDRMLEAREEAIEEHNANERRRWVKAHAKQIYRNICDGTFFDPAPVAPTPIYFT